MDTYITGHSTQMTPNDLREFAEYVGDFVDAVREAKQAGHSVEEFAGSWTPPSRYSGYDAATEQRLQANAQVIYDELP